MFFMAYSLQPTVAVDWSGNAPLDQERKAGGRYAADLVLQLPARGAGSVAFHSAFIGSTEHLVGAIARRYEVTILRYARTDRTAEVRIFARRRSGGITHTRANAPQSIMAVHSESSRCEPVYTGFLRTSL